MVRLLFSSPKLIPKFFSSITSHVLLVKVLDEEAPVEEKDLDYTLQLSEEEIAELTRQATAFEENETIALSIDEK